MEVKVCKNCRRLFQYIYGPELCPDCLKTLSKEEQEKIGQNKIGQNKQEKRTLLTEKIKEEEELYEKVRDYVFFHPKASLSQIAEENNVPPKKLLEWVRQERLEFSDESKNAWFECEICGTKIKSGRLCPRCRNQ